MSQRTTPTAALHPGHCGWYTLKRAAVALGVAHSTVHHWVNDGVIPDWALLRVKSKTMISGLFMQGWKHPPMAAPVDEVRPVSAYHQGMEIARCRGDGQTAWGG